MGLLFTDNDTDYTDKGYYEDSSDNDNTLCIFCSAAVRRYTCLACMAMLNNLYELHPHDKMLQNYLREPGQHTFVCKPCHAKHFSFAHDDIITAAKVARTKGARWLF